jgi:hypothetical protein
MGYSLFYQKYVKNIGKAIDAYNLEKELTQELDKNNPLVDRKIKI